MATRNQTQQQKPAKEQLAKQVGESKRSTNRKTNDNTMEQSSMSNNETIRMIPLSQLFRSALNVRKSGSGDITELVASIKAEGLIQNLVVTPERKGKREGMGVVAGGRRLEALANLAKAGDWAGDRLVPCLVVTKERAVEISTAENVVREAMHPADEFEAFSAMADAGKEAEAIAARFGCTVKHVHQRMKLARVSPKVIEAYRAGDLDLDDVMAYTLTDDHQRQERLLSAGMKEYRVRRELTQDSVSANDRRVLFVGEAAYVEAGGVITGDMFSEERFFHSLELLDKLTDEKLQKKVAKVAQGLPWVDVAADADWNTRERYTKEIPTIMAEASPEVAAKLAVLEKQMAALEEATDADEVDDSVWESYNATACALKELRDGLRVPHPEAAGMVGAVVMLTDKGKVETLRNVMRKTDANRLIRECKVDAKGQTVGDGDPNAVRIDLSAHATAVTQVQMAKNVPVALRVLAFQLAASLLFRGWDSGVEITAKNGLGVHRSAVEGTEVGNELDALTQQWTERLPESESDLLAWCLQADDETIHALLAYVTARTINGVQMFASTKKSTAPFLSALGVNMADHWKPNPAYFTRIRKPVTLALLAEHGHTGPELAKMKRDALAAQAANLLQDSGWLPPTLR